MTRPTLAFLLLFGAACGPIPPAPKPPVPPPSETAYCAAPDVRDVAGHPLPGAAVSIGGLSGVTNQDGYLYLAPVPAGVQELDVTLANYVPYKGAYQINAWACDIPVVLTALAPPLPPPPTRAAALNICMSFQGLTVHTKQYGDLPWWEAPLTWLDLPEDRQSVYAAKHANHNVFCPNGDTHALVFTPWGQPIYDEPNQPYSADRFGPRDWTNNNTKMDQRFHDLVVEVIQNGFIPVIAGSSDGAGGYDRIMTELPLIMSALANGPPRDLRHDVVICLCFDGVFYSIDYEPSHVKIPAVGAMFRSLCATPDCYLLIEHPTGKLPLGEGDSDWVAGGLMSTSFDGVLSEFDDDRFDDSVWQIAARTLGPAYRRPADQPSGDDPDPPFYFHQSTPRGPLVACAFEFGTYGYVRGQYDDAHVVQQRAYFKNVGYSCGG